MTKKAKEPKDRNSSGSNKDNVKVQNILDILDVITKESVPRKGFEKLNKTEKWSSICNSILRCSDKHNIYFKDGFIYIKDEWVKCSSLIIRDLLFDVSVKFGVDEEVVTTKRNENLLLRRLYEISKRKSVIKIESDNNDIIDIPLEERSKVRLKYPLVAVAGKLFQEESPGTLEPTTAHMMKARNGDVENLYEHLIGFTIEPDHLNYERTINDRYNTYVKLNHTLQIGDWSTIDSLIQHVFGSSPKDRQKGLEYFWNLYVKPKQKLPFLGLVSEKKRTGKSTFLDFIHLIFGRNVAVVSGHDFTKEFNEHFVRALVITSDEHSEGREQKMIAQKLKMYVTEKNTRVEGYIYN